MAKYYEIIQEESSDCGICCLASIIKYYGGSIPLETLRINTSTSDTGTNAYELINYAKQIGFNAYGEKVNDINNAKYPFIAHVKLDNGLYHFIVVYKKNKDYLIIMDPSLGLKRISIVDFYNIYNGIILYFIPNSVIPTIKQKKYIFNIIKEFIIDNLKVFYLVVLLNILIIIMTLLDNIYIKILNINSNYIFIILLLIVFNQIIIYFKNKILLNISINLNNKVIKYFVFHILKLPLNYLKLKKKGEIITRFKELEQLTNNIIYICIDVIFNIIISLIIFIIISKLFLKLSLILLLFIIIYIIFNIKVYNKLVNKIKYSINLEEYYNSVIIDSISHFDTIKHLNINNYINNIVDINLKNKNNNSIIINNKINFINMINQVIVNVVLCIVIYNIIIININISNSLIIYILINYCINCIKLLVDYYPTYILYRSMIRKNNDFLSVSTNKYNVLDFNIYPISINNLSYAIGFKLILNNINYEINNRDKIFIKGPSGIGKSTLLKIINNEITNYDGNVFINNKNIKEYNTSNFITYVSQNEYLFDDTLLNNIKLGIDIDDNLLNKVIDICKLNGIDLNNSIVSGGEMNRIILARSLVHSKGIIILDEVLNSVDYDNEVEIVKNILDYYCDKTIIYVGHKDLGYLFSKVFNF